MYVKISPLTIPLREPLAAVGARDKGPVGRREGGRAALGRSLWPAPWARVLFVFIC